MGTSRFTYDRDALIGDWDGAGSLRRRYVHGNDASADDPLFWYDWLWNLNRQPWFTDHQGSIVALLDASGSVWVNGYDAWGIPNSNNVGRFGYTGQIWLPELGLWHCRARISSLILGGRLLTALVPGDRGAAIGVVDRRARRSRRARRRGERRRWRRRVRDCRGRRRGH